MALRARDLRWWILTIAEKNYPREVAERLIGLALADVGYSASAGELGTHLAYLEEKGYIARSKAGGRELGGTQVLVRLTARGKDLLEHNIPDDPGIDTSGPLR